MDHWGAGRGLPTGCPGPSGRGKSASRLLPLREGWGQGHRRPRVSGRLRRGPEAAPRPPPPVQGCSPRPAPHSALLAPVTGAWTVPSDVAFPSPGLPAWTPLCPPGRGERSPGHPTAKGPEDRCVASAWELKRWHGPHRRGGDTGDAATCRRRHRGGGPAQDRDPRVAAPGVRRDLGALGDREDAGDRASPLVSETELTEVQGRRLGHAPGRLASGQLRARRGGAGAASLQTPAWGTRSRPPDKQGSAGIRLGARPRGQRLCPREWPLTADRQREAAQEQGRQHERLGPEAS